MFSGSPGEKAFLWFSPMSHWLYPPEPITVARGQVLCVGPGLENKATLEPHPKHKNPGVREESLLQAKIRVLFRERGNRDWAVRNNIYSLPLACMLPFVLQLHLPPCSIWALCCNHTDHQRGKPSGFWLGLINKRHQYESKVGECLHLCTCWATGWLIVAAFPIQKTTAPIFKKNLGEFLQPTVGLSGFWY